MGIEREPARTDELGEMVLSYALRHRLLTDEQAAFARDVGEELLAAGYRKPLDDILLDEGFLSSKKLDRIRRSRRRVRREKLYAELVLQEKLANKDDIAGFLRERKREGDERGPGRLGDHLIQLGLLTPSQDAALREKAAQELDAERGGAGQMPDPWDLALAGYLLIFGKVDAKRLRKVLDGESDAGLGRVCDLLVRQETIRSEEIERFRERFAREARAPLPLRYRVHGTIARGNSAVVFNAVHRDLGREVALKVLYHTLATRSVDVRRFLREARIVARLSHPNIVAVYDSGRSSSTYYIAMEFVGGESLRTLLERDGPLSEKRVLGVARDVTRALAHLAGRAVVHRDLKPQNLMFHRGRTKLCDFGIARCQEVPDEDELLKDLHASDSGTIVGTPYYMAPERIEGIEDHPRSDIYSLGATLYHLLTGHPPFEGNAAVDVISGHLHDDPRPPTDLREGMDPRLSELVLAMLEKDPERRPDARKAARLVDRLGS